LKQEVVEELLAFGLWVG